MTQQERKKLKKLKAVSDSSEEEDGKCDLVLTLANDNQLETQYKLVVVVVVALQMTTIGCGRS